MNETDSFSMYKYSQYIFHLGITDGASFSFVPYLDRTPIATAHVQKLIMNKGTIFRFW